MVEEKSCTGLSPTASEVIDEFLAAMRDDADIDDGAVDRLGRLLTQGAVPKPEELADAVFGTPPDGKP